MRYPSRNGLIIPPNELGFEIVTPKRRETSQHHGYYNKAWYSEGHRRIFRGLVTNVFTLSNPDHTKLHERYTPPIMPTDTQMIDVLEEYISINGVIDVVREHQTSQVYQIQPHVWEIVKRGANGLQKANQTGHRTY